MTAQPHAPRIAGWDPMLGFRLATPTPGCDFCAAPLVGSWARFGCRDFVRRIPGRFPMGISLLGHWAACDDCAPLVRARRWRDLIAHVTAVRVAAGVLYAQQPEVRAELAGLYLQLERELTGVETRGGVQ